MKIDYIEPGILKELLSGKYREYYLINNRQSTDEAESQKNSLIYQKQENIRFAMREKLRIAPLTIKGFCTNGIISEKHSGFKEDDFIQITDEGLVQYKIERPKFQRLMWFLNRNCFKGVISLCWDRISRNEGDDTVIGKLKRKGVDFQFSFANYDESSSGALHMDVDKMFAKHHSRVTSEKVKLATKSLRDAGVCTFRAPIGYLNLGDVYNKPFDPERADIVRNIFELYATGEWSYIALAKWANQQGLTTAPMRKRRTLEEILEDEDEDNYKTRTPQVSRPITRNTIDFILGNRFYTGKTPDSNGVYIPSISHKALVSEELFNAVQQVKKKKKISLKYSEKIDLPLRGYIRCGNCKRAYCPYVKKGIQYFGLRCKKGCTNTKKSISYAFVENEVGKAIAKLYFTKAELIEIDSLAKTDISLLERKRSKALEQNERMKKKIRENLAYLRDQKLTLLKTGAYSPESYLQEEAKLNQELTSLKIVEDSSDIAMHETIKDLIKLSELLNNVALLYSKANSQEKEKILKNIFSELFVFDETLTYKCLSGFEALESRFNAVCGPTTWLSELPKYHYGIKASIESLGSFAF